MILAIVSIVVLYAIILITMWETEMKNYLRDIAGSLGLVKSDPVDTIGFDYQKYTVPSNKAWRAANLAWPEMVWYKLNGKMVVPCKTFDEWAEWQACDRRRDNRGYFLIARDVFGSMTVSTTFLGIDTTFGAGHPRLFETRIFGYPEHYRRRRVTYEDALEAHAAACEIVRQPVAA